MARDVRTFVGGTAIAVPPCLLRENVMSSSEAKSIPPLVSLGVIVAVVGLIVLFFFKSVSAPQVERESVTVPPEIAAQLGAQQQGPAPNAEQAKQHK